MMSKVKHGNIAMLLGMTYGDDGLPKWMVMEFANGGSLLQYLMTATVDRGGIRISEVVDIGVHVLEGLVYLHSMKDNAIIHRCVL